MNNLSELLSTYQHNITDFELIFLCFKPKLKSLSKGFNLDVYENDLIVFFWQLISNIDLSKFNCDKALISYINLSLKRYCIHLYHKQINDKKVIYNSIATEIEIDKNSYYNSIEKSDLFFNDLLSCLSEQQKKIIIFRYDHCFSDKEIANLLNISRQAVCKNRNLALDKIKKVVYM